MKINELNIDSNKIGNKLTKRFPLIANLYSLVFLQPLQCHVEARPLIQIIQPLWQFHFFSPFITNDI